MEKVQIGVAGLGVMGRSLALNFASRGISVAAVSKFPQEARDFSAGEGGAAGVACVETPEEFCALLERPRRVLVMVKAGAPTDEMLDALAEHMEPGDILIDGGNTFFQETVQRQRRFAARGIHLVGMGVSGGEEGARFGPALMPGGEKSAYQALEPLLTAIAARAEEAPCCTYIGPGGAGHFVKMVHNGIEYADMQLICEAYALLRNRGGYQTEELAQLFDGWNRGELSSYLISITAKILRQRDPETGKPMVDVILDQAGQKGTGAWTSQQALELGTAAPTMAEAVFARCLSADRRRRLALADCLGAPEAAPLPREERAAFAEQVRGALYAGKICAYAQGFDLMRRGSEEYGWGLRLDQIALLFRGGCIIRARFLSRIAKAYQRDPALASLLLDGDFAAALKENLPAWRQVCAEAALSGVPVPALQSALAYLDGARSPALPASLLQAQRDFFGAHTFQRVDKTGIYHHDWGTEA